MKAAPLPPRHLGPGGKLGKYDLIRQIAIGGMAELYLARTVGIEGFEKLSVVKRILPQLATDAKFVAMFLDEARLAATLHHPNVAQVYDIGFEHGDYFFAMEYVHGEDLDRMTVQSVEQGVPISLDAVLTLIAGLCAGLHYAHEKAGADGKPLQIVHRDVSPSNVLVSYDGAVKLVDFGIARGARAKPTTHGGLKGKIAYMSPEQCRADIALDRRSDIYSVGTMLYELSTGRTPFIGENEYAVLDQIVNADVPAPTTFVPDYPPELERIVLRALARDPMLRYTTAVELQGDLEDFAHDNRLRVSPLVLARLMGSLFPARLEEWDQAKAQGAFFVEQHVVRTLIESGKTPDPNDPEVHAQLKAMALQLELDDPTAVNQELDQELDQTDSTTTTQVETRGSRRTEFPEGSRGEPPRRDSSSRLPRAPSSRGSAPELAVELPPPPEVVRAATPPPIASYPIGHGGTMVSHPSPDQAQAAQATQATQATQAEVLAALASDYDGGVTTPASQVDVTERVQARRHTTPTNFTRAAPRRKGPILVLAVCVAVAVGIALVIAFGGSPPPVSMTQPPDAAVGSDLAAAPAVAASAPSLAATSGATTPAAGAASAVPAGVAPKAALPSPKRKPVAVRTSTPAPVRPHPRPRAAAKPRPEDKPAWNADSPFMPVRTDRH
ncbi:MAG: protein kinase [Kofleriaceae bacterium]